MKIKYLCFVMLALSITLGMVSCGQEMPATLAEVAQGLPDKVDFNFHVKPILSDRCYSCHGPDEQSRQAGLRLDLKEAAFGRLESGSGRAIVKGAPGKSELIRRILSTDLERVMPSFSISKV